MTEVTVRRVLTGDQAKLLVGTLVGAELSPTFSSPADGSHVTILDADTGDTVGLVTRLDPHLRRHLRRLVTSLSYGADVMRTVKRGAQTQLTEQGATVRLRPTEGAGEAGGVPHDGARP